MIKAIAARLTQFRTDRRLNQDALASLIGVPPTLLGRWEHGEEAVPPHHLPKLAQIMEVPAESLERLWTPLPRYEMLPRHRERPPILPPYPVQGTLQEMLSLGPLARRVYEAALARTPSLAVRDEMEHRLPRDCPLELFGSYMFAAVGFELEFHALLNVGFRAMVVELLTERYIGDIPRHALVLRRPNEIFAVFPQVSILVPAQSRERRPDFLLYAVRGRRKAWIDVEIDGDLNLRNANDDARRAVGLAMPRRGYSQEFVLRSDFVARVMRDARRILDGKGRKVREKAGDAERRPAA